MRDTAFLKELLEEQGIILDPPKYGQLEAYYELLIDWNSRMNLTAITDWKEACEKHFLDSLYLSCYEDISPEDTILDVGTGAGFPGIPLKIAFPDTEITLLDSLEKRVTFLNAVINELDLKGIYAVHSRAEDFVSAPVPGNKSQNKKRTARGCYDLVVSRAVANLSTLSEYCLPFVKTEGLFVAYKGKAPDDEVKDAEKAIEILGGAAERIECYDLPSGDERSLVFIRKETPTPAKYPRKAGIPAKKPIV